MADVALASTFSFPERSLLQTQAIPPPAAAGFTDKTWPFLRTTFVHWYQVLLNTHIDSRKSIDIVQKGFDWAQASHFQAPAKPVRALNVGMQLSGSVLTHVVNMQTELMTAYARKRPALATKMSRVPPQALSVQSVHWAYAGAIVVLSPIFHTLRLLAQRFSFGPEIELTLEEPLLHNRKDEVLIVARPLDEGDAVQLTRLWRALGVSAYRRGRACHVPLFYCEGLTEEDRLAVESVNKEYAQNHTEKIPVTMGRPQVLYAPTLNRTFAIGRWSALSKDPYKDATKLGKGKIIQALALGERAQDVEQSLKAVLETFQKWHIWDLDMLYVAIERRLLPVKKVVQRVSNKKVDAKLVRTYEQGIHIFGVKATDRPGLLWDLTSAIEKHEGRVVAAHKVYDKKGSGVVHCMLTIDHISKEMAAQALGNVYDVSPYREPANYEEKCIMIHAPYTREFAMTVLRAIRDIDSRISVEEFMCSLEEGHRTLTSILIRKPVAGITSRAIEDQITFEIAGGKTNRTVGITITEGENYRANARARQLMLELNIRLYEETPEYTSLGDEEIIERLKEVASQDLRPVDKTLQDFTARMRCVISDFDNTIQDSNARSFDVFEKSAYKLMQNTASKHNVAPIAINRMVPLYEQGQMNWRLLLIEMGLGGLADNRDYLLTRKLLMVDIEDEIDKKTPARPIRGWLLWAKRFSELKDSCIRIVTSNVNVASLIDSMEAGAVVKEFKIMHSRTRSNPEILRKQFEAFSYKGATPQEHWVFSDSAVDLEVARAMGYTTVAVLGPLLRRSPKVGFDPEAWKLAKQLLKHATYAIVNYEGTLFVVNPEAYTESPDNSHLASFLVTAS